MRFLHDAYLNEPVQMTRYFFLPFIAILLACLPADRAAAWEGIVVRVLDGDSLKIQRNGLVHEVRLYGIDAPEYRQPYSNKAKQLTRKLVYRQVVDVQEKDVDRYGRIVALVMNREVLVNRELVARGLAWYYAKYCVAQPLCSQLQTLEEQARKERRGLWQEEKPVAPWDWKREQKSSGSKRRSGWFHRFPPGR